MTTKDLQGVISSDAANMPWLNSCQHSFGLELTQELTRGQVHVDVSWD